MTLLWKGSDGQSQGNKDVLFQSARWKLSWLGKTYFPLSANKGFLFLICACLNYKWLLEAYVFTKFDNQEGRFTVSAAVICFLPLLRWAARPQCLEIFFLITQQDSRSYSRKMIENTRREEGIAWANIIKAWLDTHDPQIKFLKKKKNPQWPEGRLLVQNT